MAGKSRYTREFKLALFAQIEAGETATVVARENGLSPTLVARWLREYRQDPDKAFAGPGHPYRLEAKVAEYERTVCQLYAENLFFKKKRSRDRCSIASDTAGVGTGLKCEIFTPSSQFQRSGRRRRRRRPNLSTRAVRNDT